MRIKSHATETDYRRALALALDITVRHTDGETLDSYQTDAVLDAVDHLDPTLNHDGLTQYRYAWHAAARNLRDLADFLGRMADLEAFEDREDEPEPWRTDTRVAELYRIAADEIDRTHA